MKKLYFIPILVLSALLFAFPGASQTDLPGAPNVSTQFTWNTFTGQWLSNVDPSLIGAKNYKTIQNLRYSDGGLEGVQGYSKVNTSVINATYLKIRNGFQLKKDQPAETHVLAQAYNSGLTASRVYENSTAIGSQGDFTATELHTDASGAGLGRFAPGAQGTAFYCNGVESMIYSGDEARVAGFVTSTAAVTDTITDPKDYTEKVQNTLQDADQVAVIGGGNDSYTVLLAHCDGADESTTFTDSSASAHVPTANGDAQMDIDQKKFGTASGLLDGTGDYVTYPDHANFYLGTDDWTIDFWVRFNALPTNGNSMYFVQQYDSGTDHSDLFIFNNSGTYELRFSNQNGAASIGVTQTWSGVAVGTWYHIALIRGWGGTANNHAITVDGTILGSASVDTDPWHDMASTLYVGSNFGGASFFNGWIDEVRISKGIARWTSNFTPPVRAYQDDAKYFTVFSHLPLQEIKLYVSDGNTASAPTIDAYTYWNGASWTTLSGFTDNTSGLASTGTITWDSTVTTAKPKYLNGLLLYVYQFHLSDGEATIYYVTVDAPFQPIVDSWDGVFRQPIQFQVKRNNKWEDYTYEVNKETEYPDYPYTAKLGSIDQNDQIIAMFDDRITAIKFQMLAGLTNDSAATLTVYYHDGSDWVQVSNLVDLTLDDAGSTDTLNKTGVVSWTPPDEALEFSQELFGFYGYAYKIVPSAALEEGSDHDGTSVNIVTGIPAQIEIKPFKFPAKYLNRTMLCGFTQSNQGNRIDYSQPNSPTVFNGEESSNGGIYSIYVEGEEELSCAAEIENRYGSNLIVGLAIFKDTETHLLVGSTPQEGEDQFRVLPISKNVGCPAPLTLVNVEMGYEVAQDVKRQVVFGLSYSGPFLFDGSTIEFIKGIENYFDPSKDECINFDYIDVARSAYDQTRTELNLLIPSGSSQTTNNTWLIYDLTRKKWFKKDPGIGFIDSSSSGHTVTASGDAHVSFARSYFDEGSAALDGTGDYASIADSDDFDIQTNFSIDLWVKHDNPEAADEYYVSQFEDASNFWVFYRAGQTGSDMPYFILLSGGSPIISFGGGVAIDDTDWHHLLYAKVENEHGIYLDGNQISYTEDADMDTFSGSLYIGQKGNDSYFDGNMDEIRIYHGNPFSAAPNSGLTDTITVPTVPHTSDSNTKLLLHADQGNPVSFPQSIFPVTDTNGARYLYGGLDTGYMMYLENGNDWDGTPIGQTVETGDFFPLKENPWRQTNFRRLKLVGTDVTEDCDISITHYADTASNGTNLTDHALDSGSNRLNRSTQTVNKLGWSHRLKFGIETSSTAKGMRLMGWGGEFEDRRMDE